ncbi:MAG: lipid-A-disaccharide synthase N-terminal domain-containing protein [Phycisphaerae bacterium]
MAQRALFAVLLSLVCLHGGVVFAASSTVGLASVPPPVTSLENVSVKLSDRISRLDPVERDGKMFLRLQTDTGPVEVPADVFLRLVQQRQLERDRTGWMFRILDITSLTGLIWVGLGLLGQVLFTGRMVVQWLVSEKQKRSVVPPAFWWMSLGGASMLIVYFTWRVDIVGVLGQATGWLIYVRNLYLIHGRGKAEPAGEAPTGPVDGPAAA